MFFKNLAAIAKSRLLDADFEALKFAPAVFLGGAGLIFEHNLNLLIVGHAADECACLAQLIFKTRFLAGKNLLPCAQRGECSLKLAALCHRGKKLALGISAGILFALYFFGGETINTFVLTLIIGIFF